MTVKDREHFEEYPEQTRLKHEILENYLPAYWNVLKGRHANLVYIDGFAGRGTYTDATTGRPMLGSPLRALTLIADDPALGSRVTTLFVESDPENCAALEKEVAEFHRRSPHIRKPRVVRGEFEEVVGDMLDDLNGGEERLAPTFLFVDPRGIEGASFDVIRRVMQAPSCEALVFFNVDAVRRVAGLEAVSPKLVELYGSHERATAVCGALRTIDSSTEREDRIVEEYRRAIVEDIGARYVIPFRVEHAGRRTASHYFIHATKHHLGFRIMKDIMWSRGRSEEGTGGLEFAQSSATTIDVLLRPAWSTFKDEIVAALRREAVRVGAFVNRADRPDDRWSRAAYKKAIIELEAEGRVLVLDRQRSKAAPAAKRKRPGGRTTLGDGYHVGLP